MSNLLEYENKYYDLGYNYIIGLDEAGRGPMAGELVVAGVIFPKGFYDERIFDQVFLLQLHNKSCFPHMFQSVMHDHCLKKK